jgi:hypothetical protein
MYLQEDIFMEFIVKSIIFVAIIISVNNFVLYYAIRNNGIHSKVHSLGMLVFLISLIEIVAIGIYICTHLKNWF